MKTKIDSIDRDSDGFYRVRLDCGHSRMEIDVSLTRAGEEVTCGRTHEDFVPYQPMWCPDDQRLLTHFYVGNSQRWECFHGCGFTWHVQKGIALDGQRQPLTRDPNTAPPPRRVVELR